ncbi:MAG: VOC family protein [Actinobacteria bacterium]|nr:VOC family protein [Actinomycetota bacterium]
MIDHTAVNVSDQDTARSFYSQALEPLGYTLAFEQGEFIGFADSAGLSLGVVRRDPVGGAHVAFKCEDHATVDAFYEAAMAAGGKDNGPPGIRAHYHENYYEAFVHDVDGNNIEAVCQKPQS